MSALSSVEKSRATHWQALIENEKGRLSLFIQCMALPSYHQESFLLDLFKRLAKNLGSSKLGAGLSAGLSERGMLYRALWLALQEQDVSSFSRVGRRDWQASEEDLLEYFTKKTGRFWDEKSDEWLRRFQQVEIEFRAPIVLRHLLGFEDEECLQILGLRWEIFRYRLHQGRLEFSSILGRA